MIPGDITIQTPTKELVTAPAVEWLMAILSMMPPEVMSQLTARIKKAREPRIVVPKGITINGGTR